jgi:phytoene synthase
MQRRTCGTSAGQDEVPQRREPFFELVDSVLEAVDGLLADGRLLDARRDLPCRICQARAYRVQVALQGDERCVDLRIDARGAREAQSRVQLVHLAVGVHARVGLRHTRPVEERRVAPVSASRVNLHLTIILVGSRGAAGRRAIDPVGRDTNFYYSFLVLPPRKRRAIVAVWDFCRAVDDVADEAAPESTVGSVSDRLAFWRNEIGRCFGAGRPQSLQGHALAPIVATFDLPRRPFDDLVDGVAMDVGDRRYATFADLREYCYRVASTVGLICVQIFGHQNPRAREYAVDLGLALQLTNILRDLPADLARGRLYVPLDELARFDCSEQQLRDGRLSPNVVGLLGHQAARAREHFRRARAALPREDRGRLVAAEIMGAIYESILDRIEARGYDVFSGVVRIPRPRRAWIAASTWLRVAVGAWPPS